MTDLLSDVIGGDLVPGRYRISGAASVRAIRDELAVAGWTLLVVDGLGMVDRRTLFEGFAVGCDFPATFGGNWDAFADCLSDLSWLPERPTVILWQRAGQLQASSDTIWATAGDVIDASIARREEAGLPPLYVIYPPVPGEPGAEGLHPVR